MEDALGLPGADAGAAFSERGFRIVEAAFDPGFNESVCEQLGRLIADPGPGLALEIPKLQEVCDHSEVHEALVEILGEVFEAAGLPRCHIHLPGTPRRGWFRAVEPREDDAPGRAPGSTEMLLAMYYPQDVPADMGPTLVVRGSHRGSLPTDFLGTAVDLPDQTELCVKAGSVALVDGRVWHAAAANRAPLTRYMVRFAFRR